MVTGATAQNMTKSRALIRQHISYYAAPRTYTRMLEHHGGALGVQRATITEGEWAEALPDRASKRVRNDLVAPDPGSDNAAPSR